ETVVGERRSRKSGENRGGDRRPPKGMRNSYHDHPSRCALIETYWARSSDARDTDARDKKLGETAGPEPRSDDLAGKAAARSLRAVRPESMRSGRRLSTAAGGTRWTHGPETPDRTARRRSARRFRRPPARLLTRRVAGARSATSRCSCAPRYSPRGTRTRRSCNRRRATSGTAP